MSLLPPYRYPGVYIRLPRPTVSPSVLLDGCFQAKFSLCPYGVRVSLCPQPLIGLTTVSAPTQHSAPNSLTTCSPYRVGDTDAYRVLCCVNAEFVW